MGAYKMNGKAQGSAVIEIPEPEHKGHSFLDSNKWLNDILQSVELFVWSWDVEQRIITYCSAGVGTIYGYLMEEFIGKPIGLLDFIYPDDLSLLIANLRLCKAGTPMKHEHRIIHRNTDIRWVQTNVFPVRDAQGTVVRLDGVTIDISDRKRSELQSWDTQHRYESLLNVIPDSVVVHRQGNIQYANQAAAAMIGLDGPVEMIGADILDFIHPDCHSESLERISMIEEAPVGTSVPSFEQKIVRVDGTELSVDTSIILIQDQDEKSVLCISKDMSELKRSENELHYMAYHDLLTGLWNRQYFLERLTQLIENPSSNHAAPQHGVLFIDMDRFKTLNDTFGHSFGDTALREMADRLKSCIPSSAMLARFGGDEFAILLANIADRSVASELADTVLEHFNKPLFVDDKEFFITPSIGIASYPCDGLTAQALLKHVDVAMYVAKSQGGNHVEFYPHEEHHLLEEKLFLDTNLRMGLERDEFVLHYQPKIEVETGKIVSFEALVRWNHPELGMVSPGQFIPIAEENGFIVQLGEWVLQEACRQNRAWQQRGYAPIVVSVNVSPKQFKARNMYDVIKQTLEDTELDPQWLSIEITEGLLVENSPEVATVLMKLRKLGVLISIDDFGTGYSSLAYLSRFEPTHLKIDQSFVYGMLSDSGLRKIVNAIIDLAHNLGMRVVAEGVETLEQYEYLMTQGCDLIQGYYVSKPVDRETFEQFMSW